LRSLAWLAWKLLWSKTQKSLQFSGALALFGLILGVACLVVSMAVLSGFETTLRDAVADVTGHIQIVKTLGSEQEKKDLIAEIRRTEDSLVEASAFSYIEGVLAHQGKIKGIALQGVETPQVHRVLGIDQRLLEGKIDFSEKEGDPQVVIGKGIAQNFNLKVGDRFRIVVPVYQGIDPSAFSRKIGYFRVAGILDLGKFEYNERFVISSLSATQALANIGERSMGLLLKFKQIENAPEYSKNLKVALGPGYKIRDWFDMNETLFRAVKIERATIFFVVLVIVLVAAFLVSIQLYIHVVKRYSTISLLKSLGLKKTQVIQIFSYQGLIMGFIGVVGGFFLGLLFCYGFELLQATLGVLPGSVYKLDQIDLNVRFIDVFQIAVATLVVCFGATLAPAIRGSQLSIVEGLKNE